MKTNKSVRNQLSVVASIVLMLPVLANAGVAPPSPTPSPVPPNSCSSTTAPAPAPTAAPPPGATVFHVNPQSLRLKLLQSNTSLDLAFKQVEDAKDQVMVKALSLLPSLSLSVSGPSFVLTNIQFLLPFLFPSNWFATFEQKDLYQAQIQAYQILELNTYGSALTVYYTIMADLKTSQIYQQQANDLQQLANAMALDAQLGIGSQINVEQAQGNAQVAANNARQATEQMVSEMESLRAMLALPQSTFIVVDQGDMPASPIEGTDIQAAITHAVSIAPELVQIRYLEKAATNAKWANVFSFLGSASLGSQGQGGGAASFSGLSSSGQTSLGASLFPVISLSNRNIQEVKEQETLLTQEDGQVISSAIQDVTIAKSRYTMTTNAVSSLTQAFNGISCDYTLGLAGLVDVLTASSNEASANLAQIAAALDLNLLRVTLHRAMLTDEFAKIHGCNNASAQPGGWGPFRKHQTLTQVCSDNANAGPAPALQ